MTDPGLLVASTSHCGLAAALSLAPDRTLAVLTWRAPSHGCHIATGHVLVADIHLQLVPAAATPCTASLAGGGTGQTHRSATRSWLISYAAHAAQTCVLLRCGACKTCRWPAAVGVAHQGCCPPCMEARPPLAPHKQHQVTQHALVHTRRPCQ